jgi:hypothetical protein
VPTQRCHQQQQQPAREAPTRQLNGYPALLLLLLLHRHRCCCCLRSFHLLLLLLLLPM